MAGYGTSRAFRAPRVGDGQEWRRSAACNGHPTLPASAWDDSIVADVDEDRETPVARAARVEPAKTVCRTECPVRVACLAAVDLDHDSGIRGGEDLRELRAARARARRARVSA